MQSPLDKGAVLCYNCARKEGYSNAQVRSRRGRSHLQDEWCEVRGRSGSTLPRVQNQSHMEKGVDGGRGGLICLCEVRLVPRPHHSVRRRGREADVDLDRR